MPNKTLPANVWDRLKATADAVGGLAPGQLFEGSSYDSVSVIFDEKLRGCPVCLAGVAIACGVLPSDGSVYYATASMFGRGVNGLDYAIGNVQARLGVTSTTARVPFEAVMAELGIAREEVSNAA